MTAKLKVLHTIASLENQAAGTTICVRRLAEELGRLSSDVAVYSVGDEGATKQNGYNDIRFKRDWIQSPILHSMAFSKSMHQKLSVDAQKAGVIHNHGLWMMPNVYGANAARGADLTPLVFSPHGMLSPGALQFSRAKKWAFWWFLQRKAALQVSCFHATCEEEFEDIRAYGLSAPVAVIPNGVDVPRLEKNPKNSTRLRVISLGRIHPKKGLDRLIAAWARVESDFLDWELCIVGPSEDEYRADLTGQAEALGLKNFSILEPIFGEEKDNFLRNSDLFVLPTLSENFALTVAESLAVGTPVISTKGAPWQGLEENDCGWWIDHGVEPLAATLRTAISLSDEERLAMGERGRAWMKLDFSWEEIARQMESVYFWLSEGGDPPENVRSD